MTFKDFITGLDLPEETKVEIINFHVNEEREIIDRTNRLLSEEKAKRDAAVSIKNRYENDKNRAEEKSRECIDECRGVLAAVAALIRYQHGTHAMKAHQNEAVATWIDGVRKEMKNGLPYCDQELPF